MTERFTESTLEDAALPWLESSDWAVGNGAAIGATPPAAEGIA